ncbi:MAG: selenium cofactor biosynthesis protein YqeC [Oscillospiraceae bacterium]|nr:selenium cofactor biosynthesis protein YqeC [Oscillospiraceae bacterium]
MNSCSIEKLTDLGSHPNQKVIAFCGAGGKTSSIHAIRDYYLAKNKKVLVTTTTHMLLEEGCLSNLNDIVEKLDNQGYAFAGIPMITDKACVKTIFDDKVSIQTMYANKAGFHMSSSSSARDQLIKSLQKDKISAIPNDVRFLAETHADVTLIEADGARCLPFKVPRTWEPVIPEETTDIVLVMGMDAEGKRICDICYNPEGVAEVMGVSIETILTREMMIRAYMETYVPHIRKNFTSSRLFLYMNDKIPGKTIVNCGLFDRRLFLL